jgi:hypothetical protein
VRRKAIVQVGTAGRGRRRRTRAADSSTQAFLPRHPFSFLQLLLSFPHMEKSPEKMTELKDRCQSCGMPLNIGTPMDKTFLGTAADGAAVAEYCKFCYQNGAFVEPALTLSDMVQKSVSHCRTRSYRN